MIKILDINNFIQDNKCQKVTNPFSFGKDGSLHDDGLYSERIFGSTSKEQSSKFGYIDLNSNVFHPAIFNMLNKLNTLIAKVALNNKTAVIIDGMVVEDKKGKSGVGWLFENWYRINFDKYAHEKNKIYIDFFKKSKRESIFINKFLVIPAKFRPKAEKHGRMVEDEITNFYKKLMGRTGAGTSENEFMHNLMQDNSKGSLIQLVVNEIHKMFLNDLESKKGHVRGKLISKKIDNVARLVANARPDIPFNCAALPWQVLLNIFDVYVIAFLEDPIHEEYSTKLKITNYSISDYGDHFTYIYQNADTYTKTNPGFREIWIELLKELFEEYDDLSIVGKRDPAWSKESYFNLKPIIMQDNSYHVIINSLLYKPLGGDSFSTNFTARVKESSVIAKNDFGVLKTKHETSYQIKSMYKIYEEIKRNNNETRI
jgi:DNA-directed RNA polymerase beta' subunit